MYLLTLTIATSAIALYADKIIEYLFPYGSLSAMEHEIDDFMLHIASHEDMH